MRVFYDINCGAPFNNPEMAMGIQQDLDKECDTNMCKMQGSRWSHIYGANAILLTLVFINMVLLCCGTNRVIPRIASAICAVSLCVMQFGTLIATGVYRFRLQGMLCGMSQRPTNYTDRVSAPNDMWTYEKDGMLIMMIWMIQVMGFICCCCVGVAPVRHRAHASSA